jgi:chemotaxis protein histidine kinase CheA
VDWRADASGEASNDAGRGASDGAHDDATARAQLAASELTRLVASARRLSRDMSGGRQDREHLLAMLRSAASLSGRIQADLDVQLSTRFGEVADPVVHSVESMAASRGKEVEVQLLGAWTRVPRGLDSTLGDILVQLARNSLDHGIEAAEERTRSGKPAKGSITIGAEQGERWVSVWVDDDGRGIREDEIRGAGASRSADTPLLSILAQPGFTTVDGDRSSSGRGVGLDVVLHTVETLLLGKLSLQTKPGIGTRFTLRFPAGAQVVDVVVIGLGNRRLAVPRILVEDVRPIRARDFTVSEHGERFVAIDGAYCPVCAAGLQSIPHAGAKAVVVNGTAGRAVIVGTGIISEERVLRYRNSPYQIYSQALDGSVALLIPTNGC